MSFFSSSFRTRTITGLIFVLIVLSSLFSNANIFYTLIILINLGCQYEYLKLITKTLQKKVTPKEMALALFLSTILLCFFSSVDDKNYFKIIWVVLNVILIGIYITNKNKYGWSFYLIFGIFYTTTSLALFQQLLYWHKNNSTNIIHHWQLPFYILCNLWLNDSLAYLCGKTYGKTSFSKWSPNKTWEGTISGIIFTLILNVFFAHYILNFSTIWLIILSLSITIMGTIGDLFESRLKRKAGVKDSGSLLPGHGGFLDRFDSLLWATPIFWALLWLKTFIEK